NYLYNVTCLSASDCWAVGTYNSNINIPGFSGGDTYQTLTEHWDGTAWTVVTSPNTDATQSNYLFGLTCSSASNCWAVGLYDNGINTIDDHATYQTLVERWDGTSWTIITSPNTSTTQHNYLFGVTC